MEKPEHTMSDLRMGEYIASPDSNLLLDCQFLDQDAHTSAVCVYGRGDELKERATLIVKAVNEYESLLKKYQDLTAWCDKQNGTPCEQIRHKQVVDELVEALKYLTTHTKERNEGPSIIPNTDYQVWMDKARAALAKAKGAV